MPVAIDLILELFEELFAACFQILTAIWVYLLGSQSANISRFLQRKLK